MENNNLVDILIMQHNKLREDLNLISRKLKEVVILGNSCCPEILEILNSFDLYLKKHLVLENETFYVDLLNKMKKRNLDTSKTEKFIDEMKVIGVKVSDFLSEFDNSESIKNNTDDFEEKFSSIKDILFLRIESEELGVYSYWKSLN